MDINKNKILRLVSYGVYLSGFSVILSVLFSQIRFRNTVIFSADTTVTLLVGLTFIYIAALLRRGSRNAWMLATALYVFIVGRSLWHYAFVASHGIKLSVPVALTLNLLIPFATLGLLISYHRFYVARTEIQSIRSAGIRASLILLAALIYGVVGFQLLDNRDFHHELSIPKSVQLTVDQFGITIDQPLVAYTKRSYVFEDSLRLISIASLAYVFASFFSPVKFRLHDREEDRKHLTNILETYGGNSEDFFKLWPQDKAYFFNKSNTSGLAYKVTNGVALIASDPAGRKSSTSKLLSNFNSYCDINGWTPALIHTQKNNLVKYEALGFMYQKIGEEAVIDVDNFLNNTISNKYFRHINNKFEKLGYTTELFSPPHSEALINRIHSISNEWLQAPGREERGFMMGYFSDAYMQKCNIFVARDEAGTIQAFINQVHSFDSNEANYDFLRSSRLSIGNINDYIMSQFFRTLHESGYKKLNMGLCPLSGLDKDESDQSIITKTMHLVYSNGDRFYSFSGLKRFKDKYEPVWRPRYIIYRGGVSGLIKTFRALGKAMKV